MKQVYKIIVGKKEYRVTQGDHSVMYFTDDDRQNDTCSYKIVNARIEARDIGSRSWTGYGRFAFDTVERAIEVLDKWARDAQVAA